MRLKNVLCICGKRFVSFDSMIQHQQDSSRHILTSQSSAQILRLDQLMESLSLQNQEADHGFIPFNGGGSTTVLASNPDIRIAEQVMSEGKKQFVAEGRQTKRKKKQTEWGLRKHGQSGYSTSKLNPNTGRMMNMLEDQDWALCDKDCGWCGHCTEGVSY